MKSRPASTRVRSRAMKSARARSHAMKSARARSPVSSASDSSESSSLSRESRSNSRIKSEDQRRINALFRGLLSVMRSRPELSQFSRQQARESAKTLYRYGWNTLKAVQESKAPNRQHFMADVRKEKGFRSLSFIYDLFEVFPPPKRGRNIKDVDFAEPNIPHNLANLTPNLASISLALQPTQEMVNVVAEELARAAAFPPPYKPYVTADYTAHPWLPRSSIHVNALASWRARAQRVPNKQDISFQMWLHHHYRFIFAAELCSAWKPFGGLAAQLSLIAVLLSLASTDSCAFAIAYFAELSRFLADSARARLDINYTSYLGELKDDIFKRVPRDSRAAMAQAAQQPPPNKRGQKQPPPSNKGRRPRKGQKKRKGNANAEKGEDPTNRKGPPIATPSATG